MSRKQYAIPDRSSPEPPDDTGCTILHIDMDAFYASATLLSYPHLRGKPVIIGGEGNRSVVLSATYEARQFGVRAAMPMAAARRLCPAGIVLPPDHRRYSAISDAIMATFNSVTDLVEPLSLDEAFLDVGPAQRRLGSPATIGARLRDTIADEQGITASVGVASSKFVAKLASGLAKPDGLLVVPHDETLTFLHQLPVGALWGVGDRTEESLLRLGLKTVADIAHTPVQTLQRGLGPAAGSHLHDLAWGRDPRRVVPTRTEKSIGANETFAFDVDDEAYILRKLLALSERTAARARAAAMLGRTVTITVRFADFSTITRSKTLRGYTDVSREIYVTAAELYERLALQRARVRLVGVRLEGLIESDRAPIQGLLGERAHGWRDADRAVDRARARFGSGTLRPASLLPDSSDRAAPESARRQGLPTDRPADSTARQGGTRAPRTPRQPPSG